MHKYSTQIVTLGIGDVNTPNGDTDIRRDIIIKIWAKVHNKIEKKLETLNKPGKDEADNLTQIFTQIRNINFDEYHEPADQAFVEMIRAAARRAHLKNPNNLFKFSKKGYKKGSQFENRMAAILSVAFEQATGKMGSFKMKDINIGGKGTAPGVSFSAENLASIYPTFKNDIQEAIQAGAENIVQIIGNGSVIIPSAEHTQLYSLNKRSGKTDILAPGGAEIKFAVNVDPKIENFAKALQNHSFSLKNYNTSNINQIHFGHTRRHKIYAYLYDYLQLGDVFQTEAIDYFQRGKWKNVVKKTSKQFDTISELAKKEYIRLIAGTPGNSVTWMTQQSGRFIKNSDVRRHVNHASYYYEVMGPGMTYDNIDANRTKDGVDFIILNSPSKIQVYSAKNEVLKNMNSE